jgi:hypothetical protein
VLLRALNVVKYLRPRLASDAKLFEGESAERTAQESDSDAVDLALRRYLLYVVVPLWYVPGRARTSR